MILDVESAAFADSILSVVVPCHVFGAAAYPTPRVAVLLDLPVNLYNRSLISVSTLHNEE